MSLKVTKLELGYYDLKRLEAQKLEARSSSTSISFEKKPIKMSAMKNQSTAENSLFSTPVNQKEYSMLF